MSELLNPKKTIKKNISNSIFFYWIMLMVWQIFRTTSNRSIVDILVKVTLIVFLSYSVIKLRLPSSPAKNILLLFTFAIYMVMLLLTKEPSLNPTNIIAYCFPILFSYLYLVHAYNYKLAKDLYTKFLNLIILAVTVMVGYSLIFSFDKFINAFSISNAYGNELTSFFTSNHEYALYLLLGIQSCMFCYQFIADTGSNKKNKYLFLAGLFFLNIILTFSRTALLGVAVLLIVYLFTSKNNKIKRLLVLASILLFAVFVFSQDLREFILKTVFKDNNDAGRIVMWEYGINMFEKSTFLEKMTGQGHTKIASDLLAFSQHKSFHNAYMQVLLQYGVIGLLFLVGIVLSSILNALKVLRKNHFVGAMFLSMTLSTAAYMLTNTTILMQSNIDSYIMTMFVIVMPIYVKNSIIENEFYNI